MRFQPPILWWGALANGWARFLWPYLEGALSRPGWCVSWRQSRGSRRPCTQRVKATRVGSSHAVRTRNCCLFTAGTGGTSIQQAGGCVPSARTARHHTSEAAGNQQVAVFTRLPSGPPLPALPLWPSPSSPPLVLPGLSLMALPLWPSPVASPHGLPLWPPPVALWRPPDGLEVVAPAPPVLQDALHQVQLRAGPTRATVFSCTQKTPTGNTPSSPHPFNVWRLQGDTGTSFQKSASSATTQSEFRSSCCCMERRRKKKPGAQGWAVGSSCGKGWGSPQA